MLRRLKVHSAGESHGKGLVTILEGIPAKVPISQSEIQNWLKKRQEGFGRSGRQHLEEDYGEILSGIYEGQTIGGPIAIQILNRDQSLMGTSPPLRCPRPGHADLAGGLKYDWHDLKWVAERASARETACRVAVGAVAIQFLKQFGVTVDGTVTEIGGSPVNPDQLKAVLMEKVKEAALSGDTIGGKFLVSVTGAPAGLGGISQWEERMDSRIAAAVMSIPGIKGVEIGLGFASAARKGSHLHDPIYYDGRFLRPSNHAGGIEGGLTNGEPVLVTAAMKPLPTLKDPLPSVDVVSKEKAKASVIRSDICAVPAACVVAQAMLALVFADAFLEKFGGDSLEETRRNVDGYIHQIRSY